MSSDTSDKVSHPLFARFYAWASPRMERAGYGERRDQLLAGLTGRVIEVGAGFPPPHHPTSSASQPRQPTRHTANIRTDVRASTDVTNARVCAPFPGDKPPVTRCGRQRRVS